LSNSKFCDLMSKIFDKGIDYMSQIEIMNSVNLFEVGKDYIRLGTGPGLKFYGCKLESKSNRVISPHRISYVAKNIKYKRDESQLFIFYVKKGIHQAIYVFSNNFSAISQISSDFNVKPLSGRGLILSLYDTYHIGRHKVNKENKLVYSETRNVKNKFFVPWDLEMTSGKFRAKMRQGADAFLKKGIYYQGTILRDSDMFDPIDLFLKEWEGTIGLRIDFSPSAVMSRYSKYKSVAKWGDRQMSKVFSFIDGESEEDSVLEQIETQSCVINSFKRKQIHNI